MIIIVPLNIWASGGKDKESGEDVGIEPSQQNAEGQSLLDLAENGDAAGVEKLLKVDIDLDATDESGRTALHAAAEAGDADIVAILLIRGAEADPIDDIGRTPLLMSVANGHGEVTEILVASGADISWSDDSGNSPASLALDSPSSRLEPLLTDDNINIPVFKGSSMLHLASAAGKINHVEVLLDSGADPTLFDTDGQTALDATYAGHVGIEQARCAAVLLQNGSPSPASDIWKYTEIPLKTGDTEFRFDYGSTALHIAAERGHEGLLRYLIEIGADIDARDQPGNTALHVAVRRGYRTIASLLLDLGSDVDVKDFNGNAPIHESLTASDGYAMTTMLLDRGADPNIKNGSGSTPLHLCVLLDTDVSAARLLLDRGAEVDPRDRTGNTPLLLAVEDTNRDLAELLLSEGADIFARNNKGGTPAAGALSYGPTVSAWFFTGRRLSETDNEGRGALHLAVILNGDSETLDVLLSAGADPDLRDFNGESALHYAVINKDLAQAGTLLDSGSDLFLENNSGRTPLILAFDAGEAFSVSMLASYLDTVDRWGNTPLFHAVEWQYPGVVSALIAAGSDPGYRNRQGITPLHLAVRSDDPGMAGMAEILLEAGSPPNNADYMGRTPLHDSVGWGSEHLSRLLVYWGANVDAEDINGQTAIHMAAFAGSDDIISWLLDSGAYVDIQDNQGRTALSIAAEADQMGTVRVLLNHNAGLQIRDSNGRTPLHAAVAAGKVETAIFLIASGSDFFALDSHNETPFHLAMAEGAELLDALMDRSLVRRQDNRGYTVLHIAVEEKASPDIIRVLLNNGADKRVRNASGQTAGEMASDAGLTELAGMLL